MFPAALAGPQPKEHGPHHAEERLEPDRAEVPEAHADDRAAAPATAATAAAAVRTLEDAFSF